MVDPAGAIGSNAAASTAGALYWLVIIRSRFALIEVAVMGQPLRERAQLLEAIEKLEADVGSDDIAELREWVQLLTRLADE